MFATVHRYRVIFILYCALIFLSALPSVVRSQEDTAQTNNLEATTTVSEVVETPPPAPSYVSPYPIEGVPGGDDFIAGDFVVGPGKIDVTIKPGETKVVQMTVTNRTGERRIFNLTTEDAQGSQNTETTIVLLGDDRGPYSLKDYISVPAKSFELKHNERARIPVTISLPRNAEPGGLYGSVLVDTVAIKAVPGDIDGTVPQSAIVARIGTIFFITIPGAVEREGTLTEFSTLPQKKYFQSGPINFGILFENKGVVHLTPYGEIRITNMFGEEVGEVELEPWFVMPKSVRLREVSWNREFLFGKYTAHTKINRSYGEDGGTIDEASYSFWVLPWKILGLGFGTLFLIIFFIRAFFRKFEFKRK